MYGFFPAAPAILRGVMSEKTVNEIPREVRAWFTKGNDALLRDNFDYAIDLFNQVLLREPTFFGCRKALRAAQHGKARGGGGFFKKAWSSASSSPQVLKAQATLRSDPGAAMAIAEQILNHDPDNSGAHRVIVGAATALELPQTAVMSLEILVKNSPKDKMLAMRAVFVPGSSRHALRAPFRVRSDGACGPERGSGGEPRSRSLGGRDRGDGLRLVQEERDRHSPPR